MEPEGSLPHSQKPASSPYPEPDQTSPCPHPASWRYILIFSCHVRLNHFLLGFPTKIIYAPLASPLCAILPSYLIRLDLITRMMFGEEYW